MEKNDYKKYEEALKEDLYSVSKALQGNIKQICTTDDMLELEQVYRWARNRIDTIYNFKRNILENREKGI